MIATMVFLDHDQSKKQARFTYFTVHLPHKLKLTKLLLSRYLLI